jgi:hypothetical protein
MSPYLRGLVYDALVELGEADNQELAKYLGCLDKYALCKMTFKMRQDGYISTYERRHSVVPGSHRPIDGRLREPRTPVSLMTCYDTTPIALECWSYSPSGLEADYCARLDARVVEVCPQISEAA